jgi:hypothetical protein
MGGSFEGKIVVKHTFLEFVQSPSQSRRRSATEGAIADFKGVEEYTDDQQPFIGGSWCSVAVSDEEAETSANHDIAVDVPSAHPLVQLNERLSRENVELRALKENMMQEACTSVQNGESQVPGAHPEHAVGREMSAFTLVPIASLPLVDFSAGCPRLMFQPQQCFDQFPCDQQHGASVDSALEKKSSGDHASTGHYTTVMLRNLPNMYTREMLVDLLNSEGFERKYTFLYLPIDFKSHAGLGYAFVDMDTPAEAERIRQHFEGFSKWILVSEKVCSVSWSLPDQQGLSAHVERYRNSPVMHKTVPDEWKPILLSGGERMRFPAPTRKIRAPRIRPGA